MQPLTIALGNYGLTKPIKQAGIDFGRLDLRFRRGRADRPDDAAHVPRARIRHLRDGVHDLCLRPRGRPAVHRHPAVRHPEFPSLGDLLSTRNPASARRRTWKAARSGSTAATPSPPGLWARGILQSEYGVDLDKITWIPTDDEHVLGFQTAQERRLQLSRQADEGAAAVGRGRRGARRGRRRGARDQTAHPRRPQRRVRLFPQDRHLSDQSRRRRQELAAQGDALDRRRTDPRLRGGQGGIPEEPAKPTRSRPGTRPPPSTPRWSATRSRSASRRTARRWRRSRNSPSTRTWCRGSIRSRSCSRR